MIQYNLLRAVTLALRAIEVALVNTVQRVSVTAENTAAAAKIGALAALDRKEDRAADELHSFKAEVAVIVDKLLDKEDELEDNFWDVCERNSKIRHRILNEVL